MSPAVHAEHGAIHAWRWVVVVAVFVGVGVAAVFLDADPGGE